jgi:hypothetical protein
MMSDTMKRIIMFIFMPILTVVVLFACIYSWTDVYDGPSMNIEMSKEDRIFIRAYDIDTTIGAKFVAWTEKRSKTTDRYFLGLRISHTITPQPGERICIRITEHNSKGVYYIKEPALKKVGAFNLVSGFDIDQTFKVPHVFQVFVTSGGIDESVGTVQIKDIQSD